MHKRKKLPKIIKYFIDKLMFKINHLNQKNVLV